MQKYRIPFREISLLHRNIGNIVIGKLHKNLDKGVIFFVQENGRQVGASHSET